MSEKMSYISLINAFWNFRLFNEISHTEMDLYFAILHCANRTGWKEYLAIPNSTLCNFASIPNVSQLNKTRNRLVQLDLIQYEKGKKGNSGKYIIKRIDVKNSVDFDINTDSNPYINHDINMGSNTDEISTTYIDKDKDKDNITVVVNACEELTDSELKRVVSVYENSIAPITANILDAIADWVKDMSADIVIYAIDEAVKQNVRKWSYAEAILRSHFNAGRKSLTEIKAHTPKKSNDVKNAAFGAFNDTDIDYAALEKKFSQELNE